MKFTILFAILLTVTYASALPSSDYLFVVSQDAPAADVVFGINFAGALKQATDVDFAGITDAELAGESLDSLAHKTLVLYNGADDNALFVVDELQGENRDVYTFASAYFEGKGVSVVLFEGGVVTSTDDGLGRYPLGYEFREDDLLVRAASTRTEVSDAEREEEQQEESEDAKDEVQSTVEADEPQTLPSSQDMELSEDENSQQQVKVESKQDVGEEPIPKPEVQAERESGSFKRFLRWIASIFG